MTKLTLITVVCVLSLAVSAFAQTPKGQLGFCIHGEGVNLPLEKFLLIRGGNQLGALRLTRITPDTNIKPRAKEWLGTVAYESYFTDGGHTFANSSVVKTSEEMRFGRIKGFGFHYSWQSGTMTARVGPRKFMFFNEGGMFMTTYNRWNGIEHDSGLEFAPTEATDLAHIDPNSPRLHWYKRDPNTDIPCPITVPN